jgi:hypothetical protein
MRTSSTQFEATNDPHASSQVPAATLIAAVKTYGSGAGAVRASPAFPSQAAIADEYGKVSGRDLTGCRSMSAWPSSSPDR